MKKYTVPGINVLIFDEEEDVLTISTATNSENQLNKYMFEEKSTKTTTSIKLENIKLK